MIKPTGRVPLLLIDTSEPPKTAISPEHWPAIHARHTAGESLRAIAEDYGVSHEAIRGIVRRVA